MPELDPTIPFLAVRGLTGTNPQEQQLRAAQIQNERLQGQGLQLGIQEKQRAMQAQQALDDAYRGALNPDGSIDEGKLFAHLPGHVIPAFQKSMAEARKAAVELTEAQRKTQGLTVDLNAGLMNAVKQSGYDPQTFLTMVREAQRSQQISPDEAQQHQLGAIQQGPDYVKSVVDGYLARSQQWQKIQNETTSVQTSADRLQLDRPKILAETTKLQQETAGTLPMSPAQHATDAREQQRIGLERTRLGAELPKIRAEAAKAQAEAAQLQAVGGMSGGAAASVPDVPVGQKNDAFLKTLTPPIAAQVKALVEGRMQFPSGFALRSPYWQGLLQAVAKYDPSFDAINYNARAKARGDFTSGKSAQQINAINTVLGHLNDLSDASEALHNSDYPTFNRISNAFSVATGSAKVTNFNTVKKAVSDEVTRVWRQTGGTESDIQAAQANLNEAGSPAQLRGAIATYGELLKSKLDSLNDQYRQAMGTDKIDMVTPKAQATLTKIEQRAGKASSVTVTAPNGKTYPFPSQQAADQFVADAKAKGLWK